MVKAAPFLTIMDRQHHLDRQSHIRLGVEVINGQIQQIRMKA
jgi:hypothetical protein